MLAVFKNGMFKKEIFFSSPALISDLILKAGIDFDFPCSRNGKCGKCKVKVIGKASPVTQTEKALLSEFETKNNIRLACMTFAIENLYIEYNTFDDFFQEFKRNFLCFFMQFSQDNVFNVIYDIGTTVLKIRLIEVNSNCIYDFSLTNPQIQYGCDVLSRIKAANENTFSLTLQSMVKEPIEFVCESVKIKKIVVTGNSVMLHIFEGLDVFSMSSFPFEMKEHFGFEKNNIYFPPCVSAFVGADALCGALKTDILNQTNSLFIDIGTNGEMIFNKNGQIVCCSVAAGPAFEGFSVKNGSRVKDGIITKVICKDDKIQYETFGGFSPSGISGSALIDLICILLQNGVVSKDGYMKNSFTFENTDISITPQDIRNIQLAKSAVRAGIESLCSGVSIDKIYVSGNFGSALNVENCIEIGLLPDYFLGRVEFVENAALEGAQLLLEEDFRHKIDKIADVSQTLQLASSEKFQQDYIRFMNF